MDLIDTHAHLLAEHFTVAEADAALTRARAAGVGAVLNCATKLADFDEVVALAQRHPDVWAALGVHPDDASEIAGDPDAALATVARHAASPRVVAVGECGLDYHYDHSPREQQREALRLQIRLARTLGKPLVIHNRASDADLVQILDEEGAGEVGGVVHAFSTTTAIAERVLELGMHLGFGGMITFKRADEVRAALRATPLDRLLLETDTPYLTPAPHRGQRNEPAHVGLVAARAALELARPVAAVAAQTTANARRLFGLPPRSPTLA